jgi:hypothetical protein
MEIVLQACEKYTRIYLTWISFVKQGFIKH